MNKLTLTLAAALSLLLAGTSYAQTATPRSGQGSAAPPADSRAGSATQSTPRAALIDINSASAQELDKLPGIGAARADAIIKNRPYQAKDELRERRIVPANVYEQIKDRIIAHQTSATAPARSGSAASGEGATAGSRGTGTSTPSRTAPAAPAR
jgi:DNA uptake protein ComE-like DNA-binding protein